MHASNQAELAQLARLWGGLDRTPTDIKAPSDRLKSSALFAEEGCSFSQQNLLTRLHRWASKAERVIA